MLGTIGVNNTVSGIVSATELPKMVRVRQNLNHNSLDPAAIPQTIYGEMEKVRDRIFPGMRIAVTCGSRGIANIREITRAIVDFIKECGASPFIVPSMGSHGGATAQGQCAVLAGYGITEASMGCPILSTMEVIEVGRTESGIPAYVDRNAYHADGIFLCGRVKAHTAFHGKYESGLVKMAVIGLGKQKGAQVLHVDGLSEFPVKIPAVGQILFRKLNIIGGLAIAENAFDQTFLLECIKSEDVFSREPEILNLAKERMGKIFFDHIDVLVVDRMGKDISGLGMDPNVTGRYCVSYMKREKEVQHIAVLDLTEESHGNANGVGIADVTTMRLAQKINLGETYPNVVTSTVLDACKIPLITESDQVCIQTALRTCNYYDRKNPRIVRIRDTLNLEEIEISQGMVEEALQNPNVEVLTEPYEWKFDSKGNLW